MSKRIMFFADKTDFQLIAQIAEAQQQIRYFEAGAFDDASTSSYNSLLEIPNLGISSSGISTLTKYYLVLPVGLNLNIRSVPQNAGGIRYFVDQLANPVSVLIRTGGAWDNQAIIISSVDTVHSNKESTSIFNHFAKAVRKFRKIQSIAVGDNAFSKLTEGYRLTEDVRSTKQIHIEHF